MERAKLAARLVEADEDQQNALLQDCRAVVDKQLAYILKDISLDGWTSDPMRSVAASTVLRKICRTHADPEISALCNWSQGIEALINGDMLAAVNTLDKARAGFVELNKPHIAAATEVSKVVALAMLGRYDQAIACALRARKVFLECGDLLAAGKIETNIGNLYFRRDQYLEAEEFQTSARNRFIAINHEKQLAAINNCLANTHAILHKFSSAAALYEEAVQLAERAGVLVIQAEIEGNIGNFALLRGRYDQALDYLERSRRRYESLGMPHQSALAQREIADAYLELNLVPEARDIYVRVTGIFAKLGLRADEARAFASRGRAEVLLGRTDDALASLKRARELYEAEGNRVGEAMVMLSQAQLCHEQRNDELAHHLVTKAEAELSAFGGWHQILLARWLHAEIERTIDHANEARDLFERALQDSLRKEQAQIAERCYTGLGLLAVMEGETAVAEQHFKNAIAVTEELRAPLPGEEFKTAFFANKLVPYNELVRICLAGGEERVVEALTLVESARSRSLVDSLGTGDENLIEPRDAFEADLLAQMNELREELNYLYKESNHRVSVVDQKKLRQWQRELRKRENKVLEITRQLHHRRENVLSPARSFDVRQLQKHLGEDEALVEYTALGDELLAFIVMRGRVYVARKLASVKEIDERLNAMRSQIDTLRFGSPTMRKYLPTLTAKINVYLKKLYDALIRPLEQILEQRTLIIVPCGRLHYLPFHALHDGEKYLIERCEISYAPSAAMFLQCVQRGAHSLNRALILGVSDKRAPRIADEIQAMKDLFPDVTTLSEGSATAAALRRESSHVDVVHLACHGQFRSDNPLFSALKLADGWFTVRDAYSLKLDNALVTLSGCETGVNVVAPGDELIGLARGFFAAGARSVLLSLWMVDDEATNQIMIDFYQETKKGRSLSASLRAAQLKMLQKHPHPFFWSPFVLVGRS
jgi:CHAT domain-containing protein/Tfp pilus assembly protein PilF